MKYFILFMFICGVCFGADLTKEEKIQVKEDLQGKIFKELTPAKDDYVNKYDRGTVEFNSKKGVNMLGREVFSASNYSYHKVIIPDGTTVKEINFTQKEPHTDAIQGKNLTFIECNLVNVEIDPSWTVKNCNTAQIKRVLKSQEQLPNGDYRLVISHQAEKNNKFMEVIENEEIVDSNNLSDTLLRLNTK